MATRARTRRAIPLILAICSLPLVAGCSYLFGSGPMSLFPIDPDGSFDPSMALPSPGPAFRTGEATITFDGQAPILLRLRDGSTTAWLGSSAVWADGTGWYLRVMAATEDAVPSGLGDASGLTMVMLDRIVDATHYSSEPGGCSVSITAHGPGGLAGTATCADVRWFDTMTSLQEALPSPAPGISPARATVTFSAAP